ncbi:hypothetical protein TNCV_1203801 [Trichonephila clavipes]|nr:hypothetical protein TNCV_1203801 [Trichonephila clavipes]
MADGRTFQDIVEAMLFTRGYLFIENGESFALFPPVDVSKELVPDITLSEKYINAPLKSNVRTTDDG